MGVGAQPDHIRHRQQGAAAGQRRAGAGFSSSCSVVVTMMEAGSPLCWPRSPEASSARAGGEQGVVVALPEAAGVALDGGLRRGAADARLVVVGVAHAGCGQFREDGVDGRPRLGCQIAADRAHAVDVLLADGEAAAFGAVDVGEVAVGVEAVGELVGQLGQLVGAVLAGQAGQLRLGFVPGLDVDEVRQPVQEAADHRDMAGAEVAVALRLRRSRATPAATAHRSTRAAHPDRRPRGYAVRLRRG